MNRKRILVSSLLSITIIVLSLSAVGALLFLCTHASHSQSAYATFPGADGKILYTSYINGHSEIYAVNPDGTDLQQLAHEGNSSNERPRWSPYGSKIAFVSDRAGKDGATDVFTMNDDGSDVKKITDLPGLSQPSTQAWSPDGTKIAFNRFVALGVSGVSIVNSDGSNLTTLSAGGTKNSFAFWSPDSKSLVFFGQGVQYSINIDGTGLKPLPRPSRTLSPDGSKIAYYANGSIFLSDADGSGVPKKLADGLVQQWSPDSTKIAFIQRGLGKEGIYIADVSGRDGAGNSSPIEVTRLTNNSTDRDYVWSPDSTKIAFERGGFENNEIYVIDAITNGATAIDPGLTRVTNNNTPDDLEDWGNAPSKSSGDTSLYVLSANTNEVKRFDSENGQFKDNFVTPRDGGLNMISGSEFGPDGSMYLSSSGSNEIKRFNGTTGDFIDNFVPAGGGGLLYPQALTFGPDSNLYVVAERNDVVKRYNGTTGAFIDNFITGTDSISIGEITFGPDRNLYLSNEFSDEIRRYNGTTGAFIDNFVQEGSGGLSSLRGLTFGPDGNLYVGSFLTGSIKRYNGTTGAFIDTFVSKFSAGGGRLSPYGLLFGPDGNLYVRDFSQGQVRRYNGTTGAFIDFFIGGGAGGLSYPQGLTFGHDKALYVSSQFTDEIKRFDGSTGAFMDNFVKAGSGGLSYPSRLAFGVDGHLFVIDETSRQIKRYNGTTGAFMDNFVKAGSGGLNGPVALAFGPDGNLYVASFGNDEIKRYNGDTGEFLDTFVVEQSGGLSKPMKIAFGPTGDLFVGVGFTGGIKRYNGTTGAFVADVVAPDSGGINGQTDFAFAVAPPGTHTILLRTLDLSGNPLDGVRASIRNSDTGSEVKSGFTPILFTAPAGAKFNVILSDYLGKKFDHWEDGDTNRSRVVTITSNNPITAYYDTGSAVRGFSPLSYKGSDQQPALTVKSVALDGETALHMWTIIQPRDEPSTGANKTFAVHVGDYRDLVFDHWQDNGSTNRTRTITANVPTELTAIFSSINGKIAFVSTRDGNPEIYTMNGDGSEQTNISRNPAPDYQPSWSPDGSKVAFVSGRDNRTELYVMNRDGSDQKRLTNLNSTVLNPVWSPDGSKIAFESESDGDSEIYAAYTNGSATVKLTNNNVADRFPTWSPDGAQIRFASNREDGGNWTTFAMKLDGSEQRRLAPEFSISQLDNLYWSPDGTKIAIANTAFPSQYYLPPGTSISIANVDGSNLKVVASGTHQGGLCWSPDSSMITFGVGRFRGPSSDVNIVNADGTGLKRLTGSSDSGNDGNPCWSPDGKHIVFGGNRFGNGEIYVMNADGTGEKRLTEDLTTSNYSPAWGRQSVKAP